MKKIVKLTESDITRIVKRIMSEDLELLGNPEKGENKKPKKTTHPEDKNFRNGVVKRVIDTLERAAYYTKGTKHDAQSIMYYIDKGHDIIMYGKGNNKIFIDTMTGSFYDEADHYLGKIKNIDKLSTEEMDHKFSRMFGGWDVNDTNLDEDLQLLGNPKSHGSSSEWDTPHSEKRIDRELSDKEFYEKYKNKGLGWDVPHNQKRNRMSSIKSKGFRK